MKVMLLYPPVLQEETYSTFSFAAPVLPPLGIGYLAAYIRDKHEVKIVDCIAERLDIEGVKKVIQDWKPDIVGISSTTISYLRAKRVFEEAKKINPKIFTVLGGSHVTAVPKQTMEECSHCLDAAILGEGEPTLLEMIEALQNGENLKKVNGLAIRDPDDGNRTVLTMPREPIQDMDSIPFPARDLFPEMKLYSHMPTRGTGIQASMITSRGCPFNCHYCDQAVFGKKWRAHSAKYVADEIEHLQKTYGVTFISFEDDMFVLNKERTIEVCKEIINRGIKIQFGCCSRVNTVDDEVLYWLKKAGCWITYLGIESGDDNMLKYMNKRITREQTRKSIEKIRSYGIKAYGSFILGMPGDTKDTMKETVKFALTLPLDGASFNVFTPYPGTYFADIAPLYGYVSQDWAAYSDHAPKLSFLLDGFTEEDLMEMQKKAYRSFYLRIRYMLQNIERIFDPAFMWTALKSLKAFFEKRQIMDARAMVMAE